MTFKFSAVARLVSLSAMLASPAALAGGSLDISLADDSARIGWDAARMDTGLHLNAALLHETDEGDMLNAGVHVVDVRNRQSDLYIGAGANLYGFTNDDYNGGAIGVGGFFRYNFPFNRNFGMSGHAYYAPPVVSFAEIENMFDADITLQYNLIPSAHLYTGFRMASLKLEERGGRFKLGEGLHFGLRLDF